MKPSCAFIAYVLVASASAGGVQTNYLARIGPAPLRFQMPQPLILTALPPVQPEKGPMDSQQPVLVEVTPTPPPETASATNTVETVASAPAEPQPDALDPAVSSQMLLQLFGATPTNRTTTAVLPLAFTPPVVTAKSSSATYTSQ